MSVLVYVELKDGKIKNASREVLSEGHKISQALGVPLHGVVIGQGISAVSAQLEDLGVKQLYTADEAEFALYNVEKYTACIAEAVTSSGAKVVLAGASSLVRDLFPRVTARLDAAMFSEVTSLTVKDGKLTALRPVYSGKCVVEVSAAAGALIIATCRPNSFKIATTAKSPVAVQKIGAQAKGTASKATLTELKQIKSDRPDLSEAEVIVSAGRSIKSAENFAMMSELADVLGAAVGASRAAVDAGYAPHSMQVGQTGKTVNPKLYIAAGISGAIQHLAGMRSSGTIVVINTDPEAPLFKEADYGIVGDMFEVIPLMTQSLKKLLTD